jgi:hypothetical protein
LNDRWSISTVLNDLGASYTRAGHYAQAWAAIRESLAAAIELGYAVRIADCIETAAELASVAGTIETALQLMAATDALREQWFAPRFAWNAAAYQEVLDLAREHLSERDFERLRAEGASMTMDEACEYTLGLQFSYAKC